MTEEKHVPSANAGAQGKKRTAGRNSFLREQRAITSRRLPLVALSILMYFLYDVFGTVMSIQRERAVWNGNADWDLTLQTFPLRGARIVSNWMGMRSIGFVIGVVGAILLGIQGFSYLYRSQTVDFYESRPEKRSTRFFHIVINSILIYAIPSFLGVLCAFLLAVLNGCAAGWLFAEMLIAWCFQTVMFLAVYAMSTLASLLTGTVVTAFLMNCWFFGIEALLRLTIYYHRAAYYATYDSGNADPVVSCFLTLPPYHYLIGLIQSEAWSVRDSSYNWQLALGAAVSSIPGLICNVVIFAAAILGAFFVYRLRKAEFAGKAVIYRGLAVCIKSSSAILFSLCAGLFMYWIFDTHYGAELTGVILTIVVTVFVGCMILEAIFGMNIRHALYRIWEAPILAAVALLVLFVYRTDVFGYDRWVPAASEVESAYLVNSEYNLEYVDENGTWHGSEDYVENNMFLTDIEDMRTLATIAQAEMVKSHKQQDDSDVWRSNWYVTIGWRMKNGRTVTRYVLIPGDIDEDLMDRIVGTEEFVKGVYRLDGTADYCEQMRARYPRVKFRLSCETEHGHREADAGLTEDFLAMYRQDVVDHYDFSMASHQNPVGQVTLETTDSWGPYSDLSWPLYEDYSATIAFLTEHDLWKAGFLTPEEIESVKLEYSRWNDEGDQYTERTEDVTDPQKIREVLDNSLPTTYYSAWGRNDIGADFTAENGYVDVYVSVVPVRDLQLELLGLENSNDPTYYQDKELRESDKITYSRTILKDRVPGFVQDFVDHSNSED